MWSIVNSKTASIGWEFKLGDVGHKRFNLVKFHFFRPQMAGTELLTRFCSGIFPWRAPTLKPRTLSEVEHDQQKLVAHRGPMEIVRLSTFWATFPTKLGPKKKPAYFCRVGHNSTHWGEQKKTVTNNYKAIKKEVYSLPFKRLAHAKANMDLWGMVYIYLGFWNTWLHPTEKGLVASTHVQQLGLRSL